MKRILLVLGVLMASFVPASPVHAAAGGVSCHQINATASGQDLGNNSASAQVSGGGLLQGTLVSSTVTTPGGGFPVVPFTGTTTFRTHQGTLTVGVTGSFDFSTGNFASSGPVTGATGKLAGATGSLSFAGNENLQSGSFGERITGSICVDLSP